MYDADVLPLTKVSRNEMGAYLCIATNGVPPSVSKRIILDVECEYSITGVGVGVGVWVNSTKWGMKAAPIEGEILGMGTYYIRPVVGCLCQFSWNTRAHLPEREEAIHPTRLSIYLSTHLSIYLSIRPSQLTGIHPGIVPTKHKTILGIWFSCHIPSWSRASPPGCTCCSSI